MLHTFHFNFCYFIICLIIPGSNIFTLLHLYWLSLSLCAHTLVLYTGTFQLILKDFKFYFFFALCQGSAGQKKKVFIFFKTHILK